MRTSWKPWPLGGHDVGSMSIVPFLVLRSFKNETINKTKNLYSILIIIYNTKKVLLECAPNVNKIHNSNIFYIWYFKFKNCNLKLQFLILIYVIKIMIFFQLYSKFRDYFVIKCLLFIEFFKIKYKVLKI